MELFDIDHFFEPLTDTVTKPQAGFATNMLGSQIAMHTLENGFPDLSQADIALIGVAEDRSSFLNEGCGLAPDYVREHLFRLYKGAYKVRIADLGNIQKGHTKEDTYFALTQVVSLLLRKNIVPVVIGGGQELTYAIYKAYEALEQVVNLVTIDSAFDLGDLDAPLTSKNYLSKIILHQPNFLFNYCNIGYQTYFVDPQEVDTLSKMHFDAYRLGLMRGHIEQTEPLLRNADLVSLDVSAIRAAEAPGNAHATPNGFNAEEACQMAHYAGISDKLTAIGFFEANPAFDQNKQTMHLLAQMIWCFVDGFYHRKNDFPKIDKTAYTKYRVAIKDHQYEIVFYKSPKSDRWWMDVPYPSDKRVRYERHHLVPCTYNDYQLACSEEIPDKWWQTFLKLS